MNMSAKNICRILGSWIHFSLDPPLNVLDWSPRAEPAERGLWQVAVLGFGGSRLAGLMRLHPSGWWFPQRFTIFRIHRVSCSIHI